MVELVKRILLGNLLFFLISFNKIKNDLPDNEKKMKINKYLKIKLEK